MTINTTYEELSKKRGGVAYQLTRFAELGYFNSYTDENGVERKVPPICHYPLKEYQVWMEGYADNGGRDGARLWGTVDARNFAEACHKVACVKYLTQLEELEAKEEAHELSRFDYDAKRLTYWGCGLYWSQELAAQSFG